MKRNRLKIVYNPSEEKLTYYFFNDLEEWKPVSGSSPLSRQEYTTAKLERRGRDIVKKIDEVYNRKNKGLDIIFQGPAKLCQQLKEQISSYLPNRDITCEARATKIVVVGKIGAGKTYLISEIAKMNGGTLLPKKSGGYTQFSDKINSVDWIEVNGIDLGSQQEAFRTIEGLAKEEISKILYCISGENGRIEDIEREIITRLTEQFPAVDVITVITKCYKEDYWEIKEKIEGIIGTEKVFPTLAKEYKVKQGTVSAFGLKELATYIFEGKNFFQKTSGEGITRETTHTSKTVENSKTQNTKKGIKAKEKSRSAIAGEDFSRKIMVAGRKASGKTTLIKACLKHRQRLLEVTHYDDYCLYDGGRDQWYEINGIDLGMENVEKTRATVKKLVAEGSMYLFYCVSEETGKLETAEKTLITTIKNEFPQLQIFIVLTNAYRELISDIQTEMEKLVGKGKVIETLAKPYMTKIKNPQTGQARIVESYGIEQIYDAIKGECH